MAEDRKAEDRKQALDLALKKIEKNFGKGSVMKLGEKVDTRISTIPSGSLALDVALGVGGFPRGRIIEVYGPESSGKTTVALHAVAEVQKQGGIAAFIDAENALDPKYAAALGVDIDELLISQPDFGEQALEIADMLVRSGAIDVVVVDSVAALVPKAEIDGEMSDQQMGLQARLMSKALRKLTASINRSKTTMIFINQVRDKIGGFSFGPQTTTTGGKALKFYSSVRMEVKRVGSVKQGEEVIGNETTVIVPAKIGKAQVSGLLGLDECYSTDHATFYNLKNVQSVVIPEGILSIGDRCFEGCTNLQSITIPDSVTEIGACSFVDCTSLQTISIKNTRLGELRLRAGSGIESDGG